MAKVALLFEDVETENGQKVVRMETMYPTGVNADNSTALVVAQTMVEAFRELVETGTATVSFRRYDEADVRETDDVRGDAEHEVLKSVGDGYDEAEADGDEAEAGESEADEAGDASGGVLH